MSFGLGLRVTQYFTTGHATANVLAHDMPSRTSTKAKVFASTDVLPNSTRSRRKWAKNYKTEGQPTQEVLLAHSGYNDTLIKMGSLHNNIQATGQNKNASMLMDSYEMCNQVDQQKTALTWAHLESILPCFLNAFCQHVR
jgi:hypothetical protein